MRVLTIEQAMVTFLGVPTRQGGTSYSLDVLKEIVSRYSFSVWPKVEELIRSPTKIEFNIGRFEGYQINYFEIYNDGIIIKAGLDTDIIDSFLNDFLAFIRDKWDISIERANIVDRMYQSVITFVSDKDILSPLNAAQSLMSDVREGVKSATGLETRFASGGFTLSVDEASIPSLKPSSFRIERRAGVGFQFNHYFSVAPLRTRDHISVLENWEASV